MNQPSEQKKTHNINFSIWPSVALRGSIILILILALGSLIGQYLIYFHAYEKTALIRLLDVDRELSIPTILSTFFMFGIAVLLEITTLIKMMERDQYTFRWGFLTLGFLYMAFDEGASIHELLMEPIRRALLNVEIPKIFYFTWVIPGIIVVVLLTLFFGKFLLKLPKKTRNNFLLSALLYLGGAIGIELAGGFFVSLYGMKEFGFEALATVEEILEMLGLAFFLYSMMAYLRENYKSLRIHFS